MSKPLEAYGMIGDGTTAALVSRDGSIDWLCWPRFDSPACFCSLLGDESHGFWRISPTATITRTERRYRPNTLILELELETGEGAVRILDFMPIGSGPSAVVRIVEGIRGNVALRGALNIRFFNKFTSWPDAVRRSLLTLSGLVYRSTGGVVAAPTTSLPEQPGGDLNWDYRYCWLRDATFTLCALLNSGLQNEAEDWLSWLVKAIGSDPAELRIMYRVDGSRRLDEHQLPHLPGYGHSSPVRIGNAASTQLQLDVLGELLDCFNVAKRAGIRRSERLRSVERAVAEHLVRIWRQPDQGMWESRAEPKHYVYSKVMCWVGIDRYLRNAATDLDPETTQELVSLRSTIHAQICAEGYHQGLESFVDFYGGQAVDASLLMLPLVGFLPIEDHRIAATIARIERELMQDGLVRRHQSRRDAPEGTFIAASFWLVDCWRMQGRHGEARMLFERVVALGNDLGLLAEEYNVAGRHLAGNFPQALSHLSMINAALGFSGSVLQRAGG